MSKAKAIFGLTYYVAPFGNMVAEGYMSGTPAITADWGGFAETVQQGVTGFRCRDFKDIVTAIERIETVVHGGFARLWSTETPLSEDGGFVADSLQVFSDRRVFERKRRLSFGVIGAESAFLLVAADWGVALVESRHEGATGGRADCAGGVEARESRSLGGEAVDVWGGNKLLTVAAEFAVAEIVGHDVDHIQLGREQRCSS
jgi:hypothetical protein